MPPGHAESKSKLLNIRKQLLKNMKKSIVVIGIILIILGIIIGVGAFNFMVFTSEEGEWAKVRTIGREFSGYELREIEISNEVGKINIEGYDGDLIMIKAEKHAPPPLLDRIKVEIEKKHSSIIISTKFPHHPNRMRVDYYIKIPNDKLDININAASDVGSINLSNISISNAELKTDVGNIAVKNIRANEIYANSDVGSIEVFLGKLPAKMELATDVGGIEVRIPKDSSVRIEAKTDTGRIECNLALRYTEWEKSSIIGISGIGDPSPPSNEIKIRTDVGSIKIIGV